MFKHLGCEELTKFAYRELVTKLGLTRNHPPQEAVAHKFLGHLRIGSTAMPDLHPNRRDKPLIRCSSRFGRASHIGTRSLRSSVIFPIAENSIAALSVLQSYLSLGLHLAALITSLLLSTCSPQSVYGQTGYGQTGVSRNASIIKRSDNESVSNIRLFLSSQQLSAWLPASQLGTFNESFELQGRSHPAVGTTDTQFKLLVPRSAKTNEINLKISSLVATRLMPKTPIGTAQIDTKSQTCVEATLLLSQNELTMQLGHPTICSQVTDSRICPINGRRLGLRVKNKLVDTVVRVKNDEILQKLNQKIVRNLQQQIQEQAFPQIARFNNGISRLQQDAEVNGVTYNWNVKAEAAGLTIYARVEPYNSQAIPQTLPAPPSTSSACWIAFHQSAVNSLQPILDNQTIDAQQFRKVWLLEWLPQVPIEATNIAPSKNKLLFADQAIKTEFDDDRLRLTLRIAGYVKDQIQTKFDSPKTCNIIYNFLAQSDGPNLKLDGDALDEIALEKLDHETQTMLKEFLPQVMKFSGFKLEPWLQQKLNIQLGRPTAQDGWLVIPIN